LVMRCRILHAQRGNCRGDPCSSQYIETELDYYVNPKRYERLAMRPIM